MQTSFTEAFEEQQQIIDQLHLKLESQMQQFFCIHRTMPKQPIKA